MIQEIFLKRAALIRKEYLSTQKKTIDYEKSLKQLVGMIDTTSKDLDDFLEKLNSNYLNEPEEAKQGLLKIFMNLEDEYNKTSKSIDSAEEIIEKLKKQEIELFKDIKQRYPEMTDGQIRNEIQDYINKLKLS
jgi:phage I-like protein